jgi:probable HAF family extracellular repeat protein
MGITAMALLFVLVIPVSLAAQARLEKSQKVRYTVQDLGTLGGTFGQAGGISNNGWVAGYSTLPGDAAFHAFLWHDGIMTDLGTLGGANSISENRPDIRGDVVGYSETPVPDPNGEDFCTFGNQVICLPFYGIDGVMVPQPTLGGNNGNGNGTNSWGELAGTAENAIPEPTCVGTGQVLQYKPVVWWRGRVHELPTFPGDPIGMAFAINDLGQAVGQSGPCLTASHALLWKNGKAIDLGNLGGTFNNAPYDINNLDQVVGFSDLPGDTTFHAFLWQRGAMSDLGTLPGDVHSNGESINIRGQVVGISADASFNGPRAWVWEKGVMTELNDLIPANSPLFLLNATSNNDRGQIVGAALEVSTGEVHAFLATPIESEDDEFAATATATALKTTQRPAITLTENQRKWLLTRGRRFMSRLPCGEHDDSILAKPEERLGGRSFCTLR